MRKLYSLTFSAFHPDQRSTKWLAGVAGKDWLGYSGKLNLGTCWPYNLELRVGQS